MNTEIISPIISILWTLLVFWYMRKVDKLEKNYKDQKWFNWELIFLLCKESKGTLTITKNDKGGYKYHFDSERINREGIFYVNGDLD